MLRHIVLFKLKDSSSEMLQETKDRLMAMKGRIPELLDIRVGIDVLRSDRSYDLVLETTFESIEAMRSYQVHPVHEEFVAFFKPNRDNTIVVDYMLES